MEKLINKDFFSTINEGYLDNQMIRFIISDKNFLIPDLYNNSKEKSFLLNPQKRSLKFFLKILMKDILNFLTKIILLK